MVKKAIRVSVERTKYKDHKTVAENFFNGAEAAYAYEYWNAAGVLIVHSAIAFADSITIKYGGVKSKGENHHEVVNLLEELIAPSKEKSNALKQLNNIIAEKNAVSYSGDIFNKKDVDQLFKYLKSKFIFYIFFIFRNIILINKYSTFRRFCNTS